MRPEEDQLFLAVDRIMDSAETQYYRQQSTRAAGFLGWLVCGAGAAYEILGNGSDIDPLSVAVIVIGGATGVAAGVTGYINRIAHEERVKQTR